MFKINFSTAIVRHPEHPTKLNSFRNFSESYWSLGGQKAHVTSAPSINGRTRAYQEIEKQSWLSTAAKIASFATVVVPLTTLVVKCASRYLDRVDLATLEGARAQLGTGVFAYSSCDHFRMVTALTKCLTHPTEREKILTLLPREEGDSFFTYSVKDVNGYNIDHIVIKTAHNLMNLSADNLEDEKDQMRRFLDQQALALFVCNIYGLNRLHIPHVHLLTISAHQQKYLFFAEVGKDLGEIFSHTSAISLQEDVAQQMDTFMRKTGVSGIWSIATMIQRAPDALGYPVPPEARSLHLRRLEKEIRITH